MTTRDQPHDAERLPEETVRRVLARASELEAARAIQLSVAELREAAREAGISPEAFEQALSELRAANSTVARRPAGLRSLTRFWPAALPLAVLLTYVVLRLLLPAS